jgi:GT2 family glycosyltransferase
MTRDLAVIIVSYNSGRDVLTCLESLLATNDLGLRIIVADNASPDGSASLIADWINTQRAQVELIETGHNGGYAFGVNAGLAVARKDPDIRWFWVLNPDMTMPADSLKALRQHLETANEFSLLGGRVVYADGSNRLQTDGGLVNRWTGVTHNVNLGATLDAPLPDPSEIDFIMGGNMIASRAFIDAVGPMREDYFLYYEEVDWALRRPVHLPLAICKDFVVHHAAGTSIGSATLDRGASPFAQYWKHRARLKFISRFNALALPVALLWTLAKLVQLGLKGQGAGGRAMLKGAISGLKP